VGKEIIFLILAWGGKGKGEKKEWVKRGSGDRKKRGNRRSADFCGLHTKPEDISHLKNR